AIVLCNLIYYFVVVAKNRGKEHSAIILNLLLWGLSGMLPLVYLLIMQHFNQPEQIVTAEGAEYINTPLFTWMEANVWNFLMLNIWIVIAAMILFAASIRKWKSVAES